MPAAANGGADGAAAGATTGATTGAAKGAAANSPLRLFVALWPPPPLRRAWQSWQQQWVWPAGAAPVAPERWHVTLHFLGAVAPARLVALRDALRRPATQVAPFEFGLDRAEHWSHGLVVLSRSAPSAGLAELHARLGDALRGAGLAVEARAFRPHVTLARRAHGAGGPPPPGLRWPVRGYALVQSANGYHTLRHYRLAAEGRETGP